MDLTDSQHLQNAPRTDAAWASLHCSGVARGLSGYTSVVVRKRAFVTPAHSPSFRYGYSITPGATTGEPMMVPSGSAGAMCVTCATAANGIAQSVVEGANACPIQGKL